MPFPEVGQSSILWTRDAIVAEFGGTSSSPRVAVSEMVAKRIAAELVLLTHVSTIDGRRID